MVNLPTKQECMHLLRITYRVPQNIIEHSIQVNKLAVFIGQKLNEKNIFVDVDLVDRSSILHDVLKVIEIDNFLDIYDPNSSERIILSKKDRLTWLNLKEKYGHLSHEDAAYHIFKEKYPELALIIKKHGYNNLEGDNKLNTWEEKIVHYADKRVMHSMIVPLLKRLEDGHKRYYEKNKLKGIDLNFQKRTDLKLIQLEKEIFNNLGLEPDKIVEIMDNKQ
jgi:uncharacterized protein